MIIYIQFIHFNIKSPFQAAVLSSKQLPISKFILVFRSIPLIRFTKCRLVCIFISTMSCSSVPNSRMFPRTIQFPVSRSHPQVNVVPFEQPVIIWKIIDICSVNFSFSIDDLQNTIFLKHTSIFSGHSPSSLHCIMDWKLSWAT